MPSTTKKAEDLKVDDSLEDEELFGFEDLEDKKESDDSEEDSKEESVDEDKTDNSKEEKDSDDLDSDKEDKEDKESISEKQTGKKSKGGQGFKFDADKYRKKGIEDEKTLEELRELEFKVWKRDQTIGRQGQNLGDLKKELENVSRRRSELKNKTDFSDDKYNELHQDDPAKARRLADEAILARQEDEMLRIRELELNNKAFLFDKIPNFEDLVDDIAEVMREDLPEDSAGQVINQFKRNPYQMEGALALNIAIRAKQKKEINLLQEEIKNLKSDLKNKPKQIVNKIHNMTTSTPDLGVVSGKSKGSNNVVSYGNILTANPEQLNDMLALAKKTKNGGEADDF